MSYPPEDQSNESHRVDVLVKLWVMGRPAAVQCVAHMDTIKTTKGDRSYLVRARLSDRRRVRPYGCSNVRALRFTLPLSLQGSYRKTWLCVK